MAWSGAIHYKRLPLGADSVSDWAEELTSVIDGSGEVTVTAQNCHPSA